MKSGITFTILTLIILRLRHIVGITATTSTERIAAAGYGSEIHNITTPDGYVVSLFRLKNSTQGPTAATSAPVVLLMHGLLCSSDLWILKGLKSHLAYDLMDKGFDVWLGNCRGNTYGQNHVSLTASDRLFWRFSWHEIAINDLPSTIDYILKETGQASLHYVGHSQGCTILFVLLSMRPEYNQKLRTAHMLAPVAYMKNVRSLLFNALKLFLGNYSPLSALIGDTALLQQPILQYMFGIYQCRRQQLPLETCASIYYFIFGGRSGYFRDSALQDAYDSSPAPASSHQIIHYLQLIASGYFRQYDYGPEGNMQHYNQSTPPEYKVANIKTRFPLHLYYSDYDELSTKTDVEKFSRILGGHKTVSHFIPLKNFAHIDFIWAYNVGEVINEPILKIMNEAEDILKREP
uniref:Lipase n=1 Tax=Stomoxys calcitrans TaxID=35570 RepID=A0A1I8PFL6_STOCA